jgi:TetR/AcrR family transcriptional repressor of nem operon
MTEGFFADAPYRRHADPLDRLLGYVDFRIELLRGELPDYTCFLGTLLQETYATHPEIRAACEQGLATHVDTLANEVGAAKRLYVPEAPWSAESVGVFIQSVIQGAFIFAKAEQGPEVAREALSHLRRYLTLLFNTQTHAKQEETP